jgi:hypothetical protein
MYPDAIWYIAGGIAVVGFVLVALATQPPKRDQ